MEGDVRKLDPGAGQWAIPNHKLAFTWVSNLNTCYLVARKTTTQVQAERLIEREPTLVVLPPPGRSKCTALLEQSVCFQLRPPGSPTEF